MIDALDYVEKRKRKAEIRVNGGGPSPGTRDFCGMNPLLMLDAYNYNGLMNNAKAKTSQSITPDK